MIFVFLIVFCVIFVMLILMRWYLLVLIFLSGFVIRFVSLRFLVLKLFLLMMRMLFVFKLLRLVINVVGFIVINILMLLFGVKIFLEVNCIWNLLILVWVLWGVWIFVGKFGKVVILFLCNVEEFVNWVFSSCILLLELLVNCIVVFWIVLIGFCDGGNFLEIKVMVNLLRNCL